MNDSTKPTPDSTQLPQDNDPTIVEATIVQACPTNACVACGTADERGWWADSIPNRHTHCRDCHVTFPSSDRWGHCASCHQTFSGVVAWDLHQRTDGNGDSAPDCLCRVLTPGAGEAALLGVHHRRKWAVSKSKTLVRKTVEWGTYWAQDSDLSGVFE